MLRRSAFRRTRSRTRFTDVSCSAPLHVPLRSAVRETFCLNFRPDSDLLLPAYPRGSSSTAWIMPRICVDKGGRNTGRLKSEWISGTSFDSRYLKHHLRCKFAASFFAAILVFGSSALAHRSRKTLLCRNHQSVYWWAIKPCFLLIRQYGIFVLLAIT